MSAVFRTIPLGNEEGNEKEGNVEAKIGVFSKEFTKGGRNDGLDNITYNNKRTHIGLYYTYVHAYIHMISRNSIKQ